MKEIVEKIQKEYEEFAVNAEAQVAKGNKAAGARAVYDQSLLRKRRHPHIRPRNDAG